MTYLSASYKKHVKLMNEVDQKRDELFLRHTDGEVKQESIS